MRIGVDLDGVIYPFMEDISGYLRLHGIEADLSTWKGWDGYAAWGLSTEEWRYWCDRASNEGFLFNLMPPYPGAIEAMHDLIYAGHTIHLGTARDFGSDNAWVRNTCAWLARVNAPFHSLAFGHDKTLLDVDIFVEDNLDNHDALVGVGRETYLIDTTFNRQEGCTRTRVPSFAAAAKLILSKHGTVDL